MKGKTAWICEIWHQGYGILAGVVIICMFLAGLYDISGVRIWVTPVAWFGYVFLADWLLRQKTGRSLIIDHASEFYIMLPVSVVLWCIFEMHNFAFHNWVYIGLPDSILLKILGFTLSFATILPAIWLTALVIRSMGWLDMHTSKHSFSKGWLLFEVLFGLFLILIPIFFPSDYTGPLIWPGYLFFFASLNNLLGFKGVQSERADGKLQDLLSLLVAGYICGFFWELFNYWAGAKWMYRVPYFPEVRIFEMPLVGFLGFGPFAVAFVEMYRFVKQLTLEFCRINPGPTRR